MKIKTMEEELKKFKEIITERYVPVLVIKLMRMPTLAEIESFRQHVEGKFRYNVLILPGSMEDDVQLLSILESERKGIDELQEQVNQFIKGLEEELDELS